MNLQITITNKDEAQDAVNMLNAYLGNSSVSTVAAKAVETKPEKEEKPEVEEESDIDLKALTNIAKEAVERSDRAAAKKVISKYGSKLSEVDEADYAALAKELEALGA